MNTLTREYYSVRTGKSSDLKQIDLELLKDLFRAVYQDFVRKDYFFEAFGFKCVDSGFNPGIAGEDIDIFFFRKIRKRNLWPIEKNVSQYSEDDLFDVIELLFDLISKPIEGYYHDFCGCGQHWTKFDKIIGQTEFREDINHILRDYEGGYILSENGEILIIGKDGVKDLFVVEISTGEPEKIDDKIRYAINKYRKYHASFEEKVESIRLLADVLEYIRPRVKLIISKKDEGSLFDIANNYSIRHFNDGQKEFENPAFLDWIFTMYLSTIYLTLGISVKEESDSLGS